MCSVHMMLYRSCENMMPLSVMLLKLTVKQEVWPPGSADTVCPRRAVMTQVQHWAKSAQKDHATLRPWPLTLEVMAPLADGGHRPPSVYQVWSSCALPFGRYGARCVWTLMGLVTLIFDLLTLKLVRELHQRWGTFPGHARPLGSRIIRYVRDRRTDGQTKTTLIAPSLRAGA